MEEELKLSDEWRIKIIELSNLLSIRKRVQIKESALVQTPSMVGFFKAGYFASNRFFLIGMNIEEVEAVFLHELSHIKRYDFSVNLLQSLAEAICFYNPFLLWLSDLIRTEREKLL